MTITDTGNGRQPSAALAIRPGQDQWTAKQQAALAVLGIKNASPADLAVFMHVCQKTGLDPFIRQIYMIPRREQVNGQWVTKQTIQIGIDGFRVIRDRAAERLGVTVEYEDTRWYDDDGIAYEVWIRPEPPAACGLAVLKGGKRFPAVLTYAEYVQTNDGHPTGKWGSAPAHQLEKCAEAFALRRAFPHDLGGIYLEDEMPAAPAMAPERSSRVTAAEITQTASPADTQTPAADAPAPPADPAGEASDAPAQPRGRTRKAGNGKPAAGDVVRDIARHFDRLGITDEEERLVWIGQLAGYHGIPTSVADLADEQRAAVLDGLSRCGDIGQLDALTRTGEVPEGSDG